MSPDVVIVGAGILGVATAYHLARMGAGRITVVDQEGLGAGATGRSGALIRSNLDTEAQSRLARFSMEVFRHFDACFGTRSAFEPAGMLTVAPAHLGAALSALAQRQARWGTDIRAVSAAQARTLCPALTLRDGDVVLHEAAAGVGDAQTVLRGYYERSVALGVSYRFGFRADGVAIESGRVTGITGDGSRLAAGRVVLAAGAWSNPLLASVGLHLGLVPRLSRLAVFRPSELPGAGRLPAVIDQEQEAWFRPMPGGAILVGAERGGQTGVHPSRIPTATSDGFLDAYLAVLCHRFGFARPIAPRGGWAGVYMLSPDGLPLAGPIPHIAGLYLLGGDHGGAFKLAPALGLGLAETIVRGRPDTVDLSDFAPARLLRQPVDMPSCFEPSTTNIA
ncbi:MAG: FAD-binding oxidoreductase [Pseudomonadota bacterium]